MANPASVKWSDTLGSGPTNRTVLPAKTRLAPASVSSSNATPSSSWTPTPSARPSTRTTMPSGPQLVSIVRRKTPTVHHLVAIQFSTNVAVVTMPHGTGSMPTRTSAAPTASPVLLSVPTISAKSPTTLPISQLLTLT